MPTFKPRLNVESKKSISRVPPVRPFGTDLLYSENEAIDFIHDYGRLLLVPILSCERSIRISKYHHDNDESSNCISLWPGCNCAFAESIRRDDLRGYWKYLMEPNNTVEIQGNCKDCGWKSNKLANRKAVENEVRQHEVSMLPKDHVVEIVEKEVVNQFADMTEQEAKLIFIRQTATKAYEENKIEDATKAIAREIVEVIIAAKMTKEEFSNHLFNLERARQYLAAFTQGLQIGHVKEVEPKIKAKKEKEKIDKVRAKIGDKQVSDLIELGRKLALGEGKKIEVEDKPIVTVGKVVCDKCGKSVFSLKFHKC